MKGLLDLHETLIARQTLEELARKADKARRKDIWTQETMDWAARESLHMSKRLRFHPERKPLP